MKLAGSAGASGKTCADMASSVGDDDLYGILGLTEGQDPSSISDGEIKKAYRKRALECHPDKRPGDKAAGELLACRLSAVPSSGGRGPLSRRVAPKA